MARPKFPSDDVDRLMLRLPGGLREAIAQAARLGARSMNSEIVARLESTFADKPTLLTASEAEAYVERARAAFEETFQSALDKAKAKMQADLLEASGQPSLPLFAPTMIDRPDEIDAINRAGQSNKVREALRRGFSDTHDEAARAGEKRAARRRAKASR